MSTLQNNIKIISQLDPKFQAVGVLVAAAAGPTIEKGTPVKSADAAGSITGAVIPMVDGDGTIAQKFAGIADSDSTEVAATAGVVNLWLPLPGMVYSAKCKTTSADTAAKLLALFNKHVVFDLTSSLWTIDAAATDALVNCVTIIGGDYLTNTVYFTYKDAGTILGQHQTS
jgi:hypothetical protein